MNKNHKNPTNKTCHRKTWLWTLYPQQQHAEVSWLTAKAHFPFITYCTRGFKTEPCLNSIKKLPQLRAGLHVHHIQCKTQQWHSHLPGVKNHAQYQLQLLEVLPAGQNTQQWSSAKYSPSPQCSAPRAPSITSSEAYSGKKQVLEWFILPGHDNHLRVPVKTSMKTHSEVHEKPQRKPKLISAKCASLSGNYNHKTGVTAVAGRV